MISFWITFTILEVLFSALKVIKEIRQSYHDFVSLLEERIKLKENATSSSPSIIRFLTFEKILWFWFKKFSKLCSFTKVFLSKLKIWFSPKKNDTFFYQYLQQKSNERWVISTLSFNFGLTAKFDPFYALKSYLTRDWKVVDSNLVHAR